MPSKETILERTGQLQDSSVTAMKGRDYPEDEIWRGEEYGARFEVTYDGSMRSIYVTIRGRSLIGKRKLLAEFQETLGEQVLLGDGLPKQHLFAWGKESRLKELNNLLNP